MTSNLRNESNKVKYPYLSFLSKGSSTTLSLVTEDKSSRIIEKISPNSIDNTFDKIASLLKLSLPGIISIEKKAREGDETIFSKADFSSSGFDFSKIFNETLKLIQNHSSDTTLDKKVADTIDEYFVKDISASFQDIIFSQAIFKIIQTADELAVENIVVEGSIAKNERFLELLGRECHENEFTFICE